MHESAQPSTLTKQRTRDRNTRRPQTRKAPIQQCQTRHFPNHSMVTKPRKQRKPTFWLEVSHSDSSRLAPKIPEPRYYSPDEPSDTIATKLREQSSPTFWLEASHSDSSRLAPKIPVPRYYSPVKQRKSLVNSINPFAGNSKNTQKFFAEANVLLDNLLLELDSVDDEMDSLHI